MGLFCHPPYRMIVVSHQNNMTTHTKLIDKICSSQLYDVEMPLREDQRANILKLKKMQTRTKKRPQVHIVNL
jgi:hypothetical protein